MNSSPVTRLATTAGLSLAARAARRASTRDIGLSVCVAAVAVSAVAVSGR